MRRRILIPLLPHRAAASNQRESVMSPLQQDVLRQMCLRGFASQSVVAYIYAMKELCRFHRRPLETLSCAEVQLFLEEVIIVRKRAWSTVNVYFSAFRFLYGQVLKRPVCNFSIPQRGRSGRRPGVLSREEVARVLAAPRLLRYRALLAMTYGSGLRVSEAIRVRIVDVDRGRMMLFVKAGKGHKDRYTVLSSNALKLLEDLWRAEHPSEYFFSSGQGNKHVCIGTAQRAYYQALRASGVRHVGGIHVLRHCFATHLMEDRVDVYTIKRWMGHTSLMTTGRYTHVTSSHMAGIRSPLDTALGAP